VSAVAGLLVLPGVALAQIPSLESVSQQGGHVSITFSAPDADFVTVHVASSPEQGSDGAFFSENIVQTDILTDDEIASASWLSDQRLNPGQYWVSVDATPDLETCMLDDGSISPSCADGYSNVETITIPRPTTRYRAFESDMFANIGIVYVDLKATPLGDNEDVKLCYRVTVHERSVRRCLNRQLDGYDWSDSVDDTARLSTRGMAKREVFTWSLASRAIAHLTVQVPKNAR
jgi:hypothetical protein